MKKFLTSRIFLGCFAGAIVLTILVVVGFAVRDNANAQDNEAVATTTTSTSTTTTTTTTLPPKPGQPAAANLPLVGSGTIGSGTNSANVALYEARLAELKFDPGTIDAQYDAKTVFAVQSLQKLKGMPVTGRIGDPEVLMLNTFQYDDPTHYPAEANRLEVNLDKQVAVLYENNNVRLITTVSTGSGVTYSYTSRVTHRRMKSIALTPTGRFEFYYRVNGWRTSDLGHLYNPVYFKGGIAVHGYKSVPVTAASHGCVRIPMYIATYFPSLVAKGSAVYVDAKTPVPYISDSPMGAAPITTTTSAQTLPNVTTTIASTTTHATTTSTSTSTTTTAP